jgi:hypothetical protein
MYFSCSDVKLGKEDSRRISSILDASRRFYKVGECDIYISTLQLDSVHQAPFPIGIPLALQRNATIIQHLLTLQRPSTRVQCALQHSPLSLSLSPHSVGAGALVTMDFGFRFRDHVLSHTVYKPGGVTKTSHCCLSSYHDLQVSRLCYIIFACPLTTTSRASQLHRLEPRVCCCAEHSGLELTAINNPNNFVIFQTPSASLNVISMLVVIALQSSIEW